MGSRRRLDERRREVFLETLRRTGSVSAASAAATPHSDGGKENRAGYRTFLDEIKRRPEFAQQVEEAKQHALGLVEETIARRAMTPEKTPIFQKGELVGYRESYRDANQLLLRLAERLSPEAWASKKHIKGEVEHRHEHRVGIVMFRVEAEDVMLLDDESERELLIELLSKINKLKEENDGRRALPAPGATSDEGQSRVVDCRRT